MFHGSRNSGRLASGSRGCFAEVGTAESSRHSSMGAASTERKAELSCLGREAAQEQRGANSVCFRGSCARQQFVAVLPVCCPGGAGAVLECRSAAQQMLHGCKWPLVWMCWGTGAARPGAP